MSVGFITHRDAILAAYNDVLDAKSKTNWALFGYEGHTNDLKVVSKGENGIEELSEEFNSGKLMYAVCKVTDPKTNLPKCVLIIWQGEGAPAMRKGICANHIPDVKKYFKAATITVTARTDEEVEPDFITEKVFKSSSSSYSFQERGECGTSSPVGTVYRKTIPSQEINIAERDKFWEEQEKEEQTRQVEERHRREQEQLKLEKERRERELKEAHAREALVVERTKNIKEIRTAEKKAEIGLGRINVAGNKDWEKQQKEDAREEEERKARSEDMRKERAKEAQQLISQRNINARAVFERNTAAGQLTINKPVRTSLQDKAKSAAVNNARTNGFASNGIPDKEVTESHHPIADLSEHSTSPKDGFRSEDIPPPLPDAGPPSESIPEKFEILSVDSMAVVNAAGTTVDVSVEKTSIQSSTNGVPDATVERVPFEMQYVNTIGHGVRARALYDYQAADDTEISFDPDDIITYIEMIDEGWWQGMSPGGEYGLFPANYVELLDV